MKNKEEYSTKDLSALLGVTVRRIRAMIEQDHNPNRRKTHFPNAIKKGRDWFIPHKDIANKK